MTAVPVLHRGARSGSATVRFAHDGTATRVADLAARVPLRILLPQVPDDPLPLAVLVNTSGGLVGGDRLDVEVTLGRLCGAVVTGQAAEKVYRSAGPTVTIRNRLSVAQGAWLEWLPQDTILFDGCRLRRSMALDVAAGGRALAGEVLVFGRMARGERIVSGLVRDAWEIRRAGRLVWADALHLESGPGGDLPAILAAGFGGALAYATLTYVGDDAATRLALARDLAGDGRSGLRVGATVANGVLIVRWLAADPFDLRRSFGPVWSGLRREIAGFPAALPRIWHI